VTANSDADWYKALGQGMGSTLIYANETGAYTLTDRGTFLAQGKSLPNLRVMVGGASIDENVDPALLNPYGVIPVNPDKGGIDGTLAEVFVEWLTSIETQEMIETFGVDAFGQPLFYPDSEQWRAR
jgi:tungstate transport system substrate-binding protein